MTTVTKFTGRVTYSSQPPTDPRQGDIWVDKDSYTVNIYDTSWLRAGELTSTTTSSSSSTSTSTSTSTT